MTLARLRLDNRAPKPAAEQGFWQMVKHGAENVVHNAIVGVFVRGFILLGIPAVLWMLYSISGAFVEMRDLGKIESAAQARLVVEVRELQEQRLEGRIRGNTLQQEMIALRAQVAELAADFRRRTDRLDTRIDQTPAAPRQ